MFSLMTDIKFIRNMLYDSVGMNVNSNRLKQETKEDANTVKEDTTAKDIVKKNTVKDKKTVKKDQTIYDIIKQVAEEETNAVKEDIIANDTLKQNTDGVDCKVNDGDPHGFGELFKKH